MGLCALREEQRLALQRMHLANIALFWFGVPGGTKQVNRKTNQKKKKTPKIVIFIYLFIYPLFWGYTEAANLAVPNEKIPDLTY